MDSVKVLSLELTNFKSFTHLLLDDLEKTSLIVIVGANGTGKSNIIDAFLYVLGENHHQNLRIRRLTDLIYSSSASVSAEATTADCCKVKIKFGIGTEVIVYERSTSRDGTSQYEVNHKACLYSDYLESLKTIGTNTAVRNYFILQGNIQDVASMSDVNMTLFLEKISGSIQFKKEHERFRKKQEEAEQEMMNKRATKNRLNNQLKKATYQEEKFQQSTELQTKLEKEKVKLALFIAYQLKNQCIADQKKIDDNNLLIEQLTMKHEELQEDLALECSKSALNNNQLIITKSNLSEIQNKYDEMSYKVSSLNQTFSLKNTQMGNITIEIDRLNEQLRKSKEEQSRQQLAVLQTQEDESIVLQTLDRIREPSDDAVAEYEQLKTVVVQRSAEESTISDALSEMKQRVIQLQLDIHLKQRLRLINCLSSSEEFASKLQSRCSEYKDKVDELEKTLLNKKKECCFSVPELRKSSDKILSQLKELKKKMLVMEEVSSDEQRQTDEDLIKQFDGVTGRLKDLIDVKISKVRYQSTVFSKLLEILNNFVVDTLTTAMRCASYLYATVGGEAVPNFMIESGESYEESAVIDNVPHIDLVSSMLENKLAAQVVINQNQDSIVVSDVKQAHNMSSDLNRRFTTMARNGRCYEKSGMVIICKPISYTTECSKEGMNKILENINALTDQLICYQKQIHDSARQYEHKLKMSQTKSEHTLSTTKLSAYRRKLVEVKKTCNKMQSELNQEDKEIKQLQAELSSVNVAIVCNTEQIENEVFAQFCTTYGFNNIREFEETAFKNKRGQHLTELNSIRAKGEDLKKALASINDEITKIEETLSLRKVNLLPLQEESRLLEEELKQIKGEQQKTLKIIDKLLASQEKQDQPRIAYQKNELKLRELIAKTECDLECAKATRKDREAELNNTRDTQRLHFQTCRKHNIRLPKQGNDNDFASTIEEIDYDQLPLALSRVLAQHKYDEAVENMDAKIKTIQDEIKKLGPTNAVASVEKENYKLEFLVAKQQFDEAISILPGLKEKVNKLHTQRTDKLTRCLEHLSTAVDQNYKKLLNSQAACALIIPMNQDSPYSDGISYMCSVPNKSFTAIRDLSSGEKSMAALALYYALREYHPAPLFLLDEVDARLDCDNLGKLACFLSGHRREGLQSFVVTHNLQVAATADELLTIVVDEKEDLMEQRLVKLSLQEY